MWACLDSFIIVCDHCMCVCVSIIMGEFGEQLERSSCGCFVTWTASVVDSAGLEASALPSPASPACSCLDCPSNRLHSLWKAFWSPRGSKHWPWSRANSAEAGSESGNLQIIIVNYLMFWRRGAQQFLAVFRLSAHFTSTWIIFLCMCSPSRVSSFPTGNCGHNQVDQNYSD